MIKIKKHTVTGHPVVSLNGTSGRVVSAGTLTTDNLADLCAESTTVTRADTVAVLDALSTEILNLLKSGYSVSLGDLGSVHLTVESVLTSDLENWNINDNVKAIRVRYTPSPTILRHTSIGTEGVRVQVID
ncbi:MAG: hypothetical protein HUK00_07405 [Bacteroidaceae bacterium]|nr:hypothetical protein [Bacteroidaceae bacterium]